MQENTTTPGRFDAVVVGAGFGGVYALYLLRGLGLKTVLLEAGAGAGGAWYHNRYPGVRCDIESLDYSYGFDPQLQQEWHWTERYASGPEIKRYIDHVIDRFDLRGDIRFNTEVASAVYDEQQKIWNVTSTRGDSYRAPQLVLATGLLTVAQYPDIPGASTFAGENYHSADWPQEEPDFRGKRVGVIGTGSSATQMIPIIAETAGELFVFQRTANFTMPAQNRPMDPQYEADWKAHYVQRRASARAASNGHNQTAPRMAGKDATPEQLEEEFRYRWDMGGLYMLRAFTDILSDEEVNEKAGDFVRRKIHEIVEDQNVADLLSPKDMYLGTKRLASGTGYYEAFNRDNVHLVDVSSSGEPIVEIDSAGVRTTERQIDLDVLIFATGFDAITGSALKIDPVGRGGERLSEHWRDGARTYLGMGVAGFPNLFLVTGPGSPSVVSNLVCSIEQGLEFYAGLVARMAEDGIAEFEVARRAEDEWMAHVADLAGRTLHMRARNSWFHGANTPGKPVSFTIYLGGVNNYGKNLDDIAAKGYVGFLLDGAGQDRALIPELQKA